MKSKKLFLSWIVVLVLVTAACSAPTLALEAINLAGQATTAPQDTTAAQDSVPVQNTSASQNPATDAVSSPPSLAELQTTFEQIYEQVNPSVVNIQVVVSGSSQFGSSGSQGGLGSGFVWEQQGYIVTNNHVVEDADQISVTFSDGSIVDADLVGADRYSDLAVIKVDVPASSLHPVVMADSNQVKVGQLAIAIGNPFGLQGTMTQGIISGLSRSLAVDLNNTFSQQGARYSIPDIIQTDASINPGNSGGVLVDAQGQVIGVTSAIATSTQVNSGVGFVIPSAIVQRVVPALIADGQVEHSWMGITGTTLTPDLAQAAGVAEDQQGALVLSLTPGGPADEAGVQAGGQQVTVDGRELAVGGDVIIAIDGLEVKRFEDMVSYLYNQTDPGQVVTLTVLRDGGEQEVQVTLGVLPD